MPPIPQKLWFYITFQTLVDQRDYNRVGISKRLGVIISIVGSLLTGLCMFSLNVFCGVNIIISFVIAVLFRGLFCWLLIRLA